MAHTMTAVPRDHFIKDLEGLAPNGSPAWLGTLRDAGKQVFDATDFPHTKMEEWRQTNISSVVKTPFRSLTGATAHGLDDGSVANYFYAPDTWTELVFVDGFLDATISKQNTLPDGVVAGGLNAAIHDAHPSVEQHLNQHVGDRNAYTALNTAFLQDGAFVYIPKNTVVDHPIHLVFVSSDAAKDAAAHIRNLVILEEGAQAKIVVSYRNASTDATYLNNVVDEVVIGNNASLHWYKIVEEGANANHLNTLAVSQSRDSRFRGFSFSLEGAVTRNQVCVSLEGPGAECALQGLYLNDNERLIDNALTITHKAPNCNSRIGYKGILDDKSKSVFTGFVHVHQEAQQTDSDQLSQNLLLSDQATIDTKPQLEIYADDVKCTHGATVGSPPDEIIFYFRSRGIDEETARGMLTYAFADEVAGEVEIEAVSKRLDRWVYEKYSPKF